jgi:serine/threonine protein kinase
MGEVRHMREDGDGVPSDINPRDAGQFDDVEKPRSAEPSVVHDDDSGQFEREAPGDLPAWVGDGKITPKPLERKPEAKAEAETDEDGAVGAERIARMKRGQKVGRYTLVKELSGGKSRDVWVAQDTSGEYVLLKLFDEVIYPARTDPSFEKLARKFDEWEAHHRSVLDALRKLNVGDGALVLPLDQGRIDSGQQLYRVYPLVERAASRTPTSGALPALAENLSSLVSELKDSDVQLRVLRTLLISLWQLHRRGIVHGDVKPENVLMQSSPMGYVTRLIDYDNCYFSGRPLHSSVVGGTDEYFSPERYRYQEGELEDPSELTVKSDVYSVGLLVQRMFSIRRGKDARARMNLSFGPPALSELLSQTLAEDPRVRPDTHRLLCASGVYLRR